MKEKLSELCFKVLKFISSFLPLKNTVLFESNPDFADNALPVYHELLKRQLNKKYKIVWLLNSNHHNLKLPDNVYAFEREGSIKNRFRYYWLTSRSRFIFDSNIFVQKVHKEQIRIHLKHGLPMKDASDYTKTIGNLDLLCVPSDFWIDVCSKEHSISKDLIKPLGFPRNDVLFPQPHKHKTVIWMPTFRRHSRVPSIGSGFDYNSIMPFGLPNISDFEQLQEINDLFKKNNAYLLIRLHPAQDTSGISLSDMSNIKICNDAFINSHNTTLYKLLTYTDALISDYSSIYYDYLLLDKPIALATFDFEHYKKHNGILAQSYEEFKKLFPAFFIEKYSDLISFFKNVFEDNSDAYRCAPAKKKYMGSCDNRSAEKIVNYLIENYNL
ncbi:MAG: CDP-glycerol glycerophosphotransferase family protein [Clostridia bacterium]|nr:CDP-glycerol glycerophosphotransferase family protein [Clostridia bacterium]